MQPQQFRVYDDTGIWAYNNTENLPRGFPHLARPASFEGELELVGQVALAGHLARGVSVEVGVHDAEEGLLELEVGLHGAGGAVEDGFGAVQEDDRRQVVQLGHLAVQGGLLRESRVGVVLDRVALLVVVALRHRRLQQCCQQ